MSNPLNTLIDSFAKLPGIGQRSARRMVLQLIRQREQLLHPLVKAMLAVDEHIATCTQCGNLDVSDPCSICTDTRRDKRLLCIVEDLGDLWAIERSHMFHGQYHVLGGTLSAIDGRGPDALNMHSLNDRIKHNEVNEVILALNATVDGQTTAHFVHDHIQATGVKITQLAQGIPMGGELDYLDDGTLGAALKARVAS